MTNETLERHVTDELWWDPKIDSEAIAVSVDDGIVTLRGTVGSFRQKREAKRAAERVYVAYPCGSTAPDLGKRHLQRTWQ
jgi:osmotically-inducible protein OsmY